MTRTQASVGRDYDTRWAGVGLDYDTRRAGVGLGYDTRGACVGLDYDVKCAASRYLTQTRAFCYADNSSAGMANRQRFAGLL
jgi:hypothetical protein